MRYLFYCMIICGLGLLFHESLDNLFKSIFKTKQKSIEGKVTSHIKEYIIILCKDKEADWGIKKAHLLIIGSCAIIVTCLFCAFRMHMMGLMIVFLSLIMGMMPYIWLRAMVASVQLLGSYEGQMVISEILNQYKINNKNILEGIDKSLVNLDNAPITKHLLFKVSHGLKLCKNDEEIKNIAGDFTKATNTEWGKMLAQNIYAAASEGSDVTAGLEDLLKECQYAKKIIEQGIRINNEAFAIIKYLSPLMYVVLMWTFVELFDFSISDLIHYQIFEPTGFLIFIAMLITFFINLVAIKLLAKPKFDV